MSIYEVLAFDMPIIAYSVVHQQKNSIPSKEYVKSIRDFRNGLLDESEKIQSVWQNHLTELVAKSVQTSRGNLSQFLSTPLQSDTVEIQKIIQDQINQISEQLLPKIHYGLLGGYDGRYLTDAKQNEIPKSYNFRLRKSMQEQGFKINKSTNVFESLYLIQGGYNLDILEYIIRMGMGIYNSAHGVKLSKLNKMISAIYNLRLLDGNLQNEHDKFELQLKFTKDKTHYDIFYKEIEESFKVFRTEIHDLNVSIWQRKLGLGIGEEFVLRIRTKDRLTMRNTINVVQKFTQENNTFSKALGAGNWFVKEIF